MKPSSFKSNLLMIIMLGMILTAASCGKGDNPAPASECCDCLKEATTTGRGTMSMKIDGRIWSNCNVKNKNYPTVDVYWDPLHDIFRIKGTQYYSAQSSESFSINPFEPFLGNYSRQKYKGLFRLFYLGSSYGWAEFAMDTTKPFSLHVHYLDEEKRIISGTFECWMIENDGGVDTTTLRITEGRFDTKY